MRKITVIVPVHKIEGNYSEMLKNAINSIGEFHDDINLLVICPPQIKNEILTNAPTLHKEEVIVNNGNTDFCSQVNLGITKTKTEWFTILEMDDEFKHSWFTSMNEYMNFVKDVDVFLPIVKDVNVEGKFLSFTNESTWAYGFTNEQGYLDNEVLMDFQNYQISGGLYRTQVIKDNGMLKENIKLTFGYEFLLRLTQNNVKILTVPKIGYQHVNFREDSLFWLYKNNDDTKLSEKEVKFWVETAKKEFFFKTKRDVTYVES
jgi:hypothetical protein